MFRCNHCENYRDKSECCEDPTSDYGNICEECADAYACEQKDKIAAKVSKDFNSSYKEFLSTCPDNALLDSHNKLYLGMTMALTLRHLLCCSSPESISAFFAETFERILEETNKNETLEKNNGLRQPKQ